MAVWRRSRKAPTEISQPRSHFEGCFAAAKPPFGTRVPLRSTHAPISQLWNGLRNSHFVAKWFPNFQMAVKWSSSFKMATKRFSSFKMTAKMFLFSPWAVKLPFGCEMISQPHSYPLPNPSLAAKKMASKLQNGYDMISKLRNGYEMASKIQNDLQAIKMTCKMKRGLRKHFAKPRKVVKMPTKPRTMHLKRRALSLRSHTRILSLHFLSP